MFSFHHALMRYWKLEATFKQWISTSQNVWQLALSYRNNLTHTVFFGFFWLRHFDQKFKMTRETWHASVLCRVFPLSKLTQEMETSQESFNVISRISATRQKEVTIAFYSHRPTAKLPRPQNCPQSYTRCFTQINISDNNVQIDIGSIRPVLGDNEQHGSPRRQFSFFLWLGFVTWFLFASL